MQRQQDEAVGIGSDPQHRGEQYHPEDRQVVLHQRLVEEWQDQWRGDRHTKREQHGPGADLDLQPALERTKSALVRAKLLTKALNAGTL